MSETPNNVIVKLIAGLSTIFVALALVYVTATKYMAGKKGMKEMMELIKTLFIGLALLGVIGGIILMF